MNIHDFFSNIENNISEWLKFAEAKNIALITFNSAGIWFTLDKLSDSKFLIPEIFLTSILICLISSTLLCFVSLFSASTENKFINLFINFVLKSYPMKKSRKDNLLYFLDIIKYSPEEYLDNIIQNLPKDEQFVSKILMFQSNQITALSKIATTKYLLFNYSLKPIFILFIIGCISIIIA